MPPSTPILDQFNRADATLTTGSTEWAIFSGVGHFSPKISSSALISTSFGTTSQAYWTKKFDENQEAYFTIVQRNAPYQQRIRLRVQDATGLTYYDFSTLPRIEKHVGASTTILTVDQASIYVPGDLFWAQAIGSNLILWRNETIVYSVTDAAITGPGYIAVETDDTTPKLDDFGGGNITASLTNVDYTKIPKQVLTKAKK